MKRILALNPGATSTKLAVFDDAQVFLRVTVEHQGTSLDGFKRVIDQFQYRLDLILAALAEAGLSLDSLDAVADLLKLNIVADKPRKGKAVRGGKH